MDSLHEAFNYLKKIKYEIKNINRFFIDASFCKYIKEYADDSYNQKLYMPSKNHFYRARLYLESDQYEKYHNPSAECFAGYDEINSFVNLRNSIEGRGNPLFIPYLYISTTIDGAVVETRPCANTMVSVAQIDLLEPLRILNFGKTSVVMNGALDIDNGMFKADLLMYINDEFSKPNYQEGGYLLTQYICEYAKNLGFDGVRYHSAFSDPVKAYKGKNAPYANLVIFNYHKCKAVNSRLYYVSRMVPKIKAISK